MPRTICGCNLSVISSQQRESSFFARFLRATRRKKGGTKAGGNLSRLRRRQPHLALPTAEGAVRAVLRDLRFAPPSLLSLSPPPFPFPSRVVSISPRPLLSRRGARRSHDSRGVCERGNGGRRGGGGAENTPEFVPSLPKEGNVDDYLEMKGWKYAAHCSRVRRRRLGLETLLAENRGGIEQRKGKKAQSSVCVFFRALLAACGPNFLPFYFLTSPLSFFLFLPFFVRPDRVCIPNRTRSRLEKKGGGGKEECL